MKQLFSTILLIAATLQCSGQDFVGSAKLPKVSADGFYRVELTTDLTSHLNSSLSNVRIVDNNNAEVPYILQSESPVYFSKAFRKYEVVDKQQTKNCCTTLILGNPLGQPINNISLSIRNADVEKHARLLGSDDKENWYALKERFEINSISNQSQTSEVRIVDFPLSNYAFYKVEINDSSSAPLNILAAGYYDTNSEDGKFSEIKSKFNKRDSVATKKTYIHIQFDTTHLYDRVTLKLQGAPYFLRYANLYTKKLRKGRKGARYVYDLLSSFVISSKQTSVLDLEAEFGQDLLVVIDNEDNPPLDIAIVKVEQLNRYLTAWLKEGSEYDLKFGKPDQRAPVYDIDYFKENIPVELKTIRAEVFAGKGDSIKTNKTFFTSTLFVWVAIIGVIAVLGLMAIKMVRETTQRPN